MMNLTVKAVILFIIALYLLWYVSLIRKRDDLMKFCLYILTVVWLSPYDGTSCVLAKMICLVN